MLPRVKITEDAVNKAVSAFGQATIIVKRDSEKIERGELDLKIGLKKYRREFEDLGIKRVREHFSDILNSVERTLHQTNHG